MNIYMRNTTIAAEIIQNGDFAALKNALQHAINDDEHIVRLTFDRASSQEYRCNLCVIHAPDISVAYEDIFDFSPRPFESETNYTVVSLIPTGISAAVGGDSGDGQAAMRLLSSVADTLITHPNTVNGADILETTANMLYLEGSILSRFMMGNIGVLPVAMNKTLLLVDDIPGPESAFTKMAVNAASAARLGLGAKIDVQIVKSPPKTQGFLNSNNEAVGQIDNFNAWYDIIERNKDHYDAFAINSMIDIQDSLKLSYFHGDVTTNPWGGVEAMITHSLSLLFNKPIVHSPLDYSFTHTQNAVKVGIVEPSRASEIISKTYLHCILKGLHTSPKIISKQYMHQNKNIVNATDVNCLVIPDRCVGLPVLAALRNNIKVIAVDDNENVLHNNLDELNWQEDQFFRARNYLEAAGLIAAFKKGIDPKTVVRPLLYTKLLENN